VRHIFLPYFDNRESFAGVGPGHVAPCGNILTREKYNGYAVFKSKNWTNGGT
jgi:hypothetical protein